MLSLKHPLIVAPMAGGPSSVELVVASSEAGALGSIGAAYLSPAQLEEFVARVRLQTALPFAINLFLPHALPIIAASQLQKALGATARFRRELGLTDPHLSPPYDEDFESQFAKVMDLRPAVLSFVFGLLSPVHIREARQRGIYLIGTATSFEEALALEASGVDAVTLQGFEAGGHRGLFDAAAEDPRVPLRELLRQCVGKIGIPLIAAGGIMNREDIREVLSLGAQAVQMGTAFLNCLEAGTSAPYRAALSASVRDTQTTRVFSGRWARGIRNRFVREMEAAGEDVLLPFPAQNKFTRDLRAASLKNNSAEFLSLWAGTGEGELWAGFCADLIGELFK